ncbi:MAG: hypothetical protein R3332_01740 [Pseudohongiellaceae bacterium]|nr:hypothetical protein [Pseudohongiellaceae bacterium]
MSQSCSKQTLYFSGQRSVEIREESLTVLAAGQVLVRTLCSAISAGTEMLVYRGQLPTEMDVDSSLSSLSDNDAYPMPYGYACVGEVLAVGENIARDTVGKRVFVFHPHSNFIISDLDSCQIVPDDVSSQAALFLANMETAINLVQDVKPLVGETGAVIGQGIVGLLTAALLSEFPLASLCTVDKQINRRVLSSALNKVKSFDPDAQLQELQAALESSAGGTDFIVEVSGAPAALNLAIDLSGYGSRIIIGSWYGTKNAAINLGGKVHRNRLNIYSSQVSSIAPHLTARWSKARRFEVVWDAIRRLRPEQFIAKTVELTDASDVYHRIDTGEDQDVQTIFTY